MHFCKLRKEHAEPIIKLYGNNIQTTNTIKFLGLTLDKKLTLKTHIQQLKNRMPQEAKPTQMLIRSSMGRTCRYTTNYIQNDHTVQN